MGLPPEVAAQAQKKKNNPGVIQPIPGMLINVDKKKKKKKSGWCTFSISIFYDNNIMGFIPIRLQIM